MGQLGGVVHQERGWTYVLIVGAGHLVPRTNPLSVRFLIFSGYSLLTFFRPSYFYASSFLEIMKPDLLRRANLELSMSLAAKKNLWKASFQEETRSTMAMAPLNQLTSSRPQPVLRGKRSLQGSIQRLAQQPCECQWHATLSHSSLGHRTLATFK